MQGNSITTSSAPQATDVQPQQRVSRMASRTSRLASYVLSNAWVSAGLIFLVTRLVALAGAYSGISYIISVEPARNKGWLAELAMMWDAAWYVGIAANSYHYDPSASGGSDVAFAPLYPFGIRAVSSGLHWVTFGWDWGNPQWGAYIAAGLLISNIAFYFALVLLIRLLAPRLGMLGAGLAALGLSSLPTAFFFSAMYTEGLFLLLVLACFALARSDWRWKWLCVGLVGMLASLDRFAGLLLLPALAVEYMSQKKWRWREIRPDIVWLGLVPAGTGIFVLFLWAKFGSPFVLNDSMLKGWNHQGSFFLVTYWESLSQLWLSLTGVFPATGDPVLYYGQGSRLYLILDLALPVILLLGAWFARKKLMASEWVWLVLGIIYPLSTNITFSLARYVLPLWPGIIWLGMVKGRARAIAVGLILVSLGLMAWCSSIYGSAKWIG
jgi:hypothetical protein